MRTDTANTCTNTTTTTTTYSTTNTIAMVIFLHFNADRYGLYENGIDPPWIYYLSKATTLKVLSKQVVKMIQNLDKGFGLGNKNLINLFNYI